MKKDVVLELTQKTNKRKQAVSNSQVLGEIKGYLQDKEMEDLQLLRDLSPHSSLVQSEDEKGKMIEIENAEKFLGGTVFRKGEILKLAVKYRLKFLSSRLYKSYIPPAVIGEIRLMEQTIKKSIVAQQADRRNMTAEEFDASGRVGSYNVQDEIKDHFYILAPSKCFILKKEGMFEPKDVDPIMFYSADGINFRLIKKWGTDFTIFRRWLGYTTQNQFRWRFFNLVVPILLFATLLTGILCYFTNINNWEIALYTYLPAFILSIPCMLLGEFKHNVFGKDYVENTYSFSLFNSN